MVNFARPTYVGFLGEFKKIDTLLRSRMDTALIAPKLIYRWLVIEQLKPFVLQRDKQYLFTQLPPKKEYVIMCKLTDAQAQSYRSFFQHSIQLAVRRIRWMFSVANIFHWLSKTTRMWYMKRINN
ncbi:hypothetical protein PsorP6_002790 [Peronosclerospora sorghi]|uniref:Uncharacterized protein n=1 Tax=Peronosclerospora sorghi TaxID=230839 RepID=A0ACC0VIV0_9STRA|nr:hypothetical protein PsorP6_002790 [Peronosclerospora sorghi]